METLHTLCAVHFFLHAYKLRGTCTVLPLTPTRTPSRLLLCSFTLHLRKPPAIKRQFGPNPTQAANESANSGEDTRHSEASLKIIRISRNNGTRERGAREAEDGAEEASEAEAESDLGRRARRGYARGDDADNQPRKHAIDDREPDQLCLRMQRDPECQMQDGAPERPDREHVQPAHLVAHARDQAADRRARVEERDAVEGQGRRAAKGEQALGRVEEGWEQAGKC